VNTIERLWREANADHLYMLLTEHHRRCAVCTPKADCPEGAKLLKAWGEADAQLGPPWEHTND
jgi:hypothetical protein